MSDLTKTPHTNQSQKTFLQLFVHGKIHAFSDIPFHEAKNLITKLKPFRVLEEPKMSKRSGSVEWRKLAEKRFLAAGGEGAYMVRAARTKMGLTQVQLAKRLHMPQANLSQIETGSRKLGKNLAKRLSKIFKLDYRVFL